MRNLDALAIVSTLSGMNIAWRGEQQVTCHTTTKGGMDRDAIIQFMTETTGYDRGQPFGVQVDRLRHTAQQIMRGPVADVERTYHVRPAATGPDDITMTLNDLRARGRLAREAAIAFEKATNAQQLRAAIEDNSAHWAEDRSVTVTDESFQTVKAQLIEKELKDQDYYTRGVVAHMQCNSRHFAQS